MFQHTATRRWLPANSDLRDSGSIVSTHSHPKVAAYYQALGEHKAEVSTHSHPKVAAKKLTALLRDD